jgi:cytochrome P450 family 4
MFLGFSFNNEFFVFFSLYPAVPIIARRLGEDVKIGKRVLPAGAEVFILPYATHRIEHVYPEPEKFIPERFSTTNIENRNPYAFLPFSAGK